MLTRRLSQVIFAFAILYSGLVGVPRMSQAATLGTHNYYVTGVQVILLSVKRTSDGYLTLRWEYHNTTGSPQTIGADSGAQSATNGPWSLAWDINVMAGGSQYALVTSPTVLAGTHPAKDAGTPTYVLGPHKTFETWAKVPSPPKTATSCTVIIRGADPFEDIPIT
jgi:hypothetical protein